MNKKDDVDKRKPNYRDFPPTKETKKFRMWELPALDIKTEKTGKSMDTLGIDFSKERMYETRVYDVPSGSFKILSKINIETKMIDTIIKMPSGVFAPSDGKSFTEDEYRKEVERIEGFLSRYIDVEKSVLVSDGSETNEMMRSAVEKYKKNKED